MDIKHALSDVILECLKYLDQQQYDQIAPSIILDEHLSHEQIDVMESDEFLGSIWKFVDSFFDATSHRFPHVYNGLSSEEARVVVEEIAGFLIGKTKSLSPFSKQILEKYK